MKGFLNSPKYIEMIRYELQHVDYALAKQIPDMINGFEIQTNYGSLVIPEDKAIQFVNVAQRVLKARKEHLEKHLLKALKSGGAA